MCVCLCVPGFTLCKHVLGSYFYRVTVPAFVVRFFKIKLNLVTTVSCEEDVNNWIFTPFLTSLSSRKLEVWLSLGGFHERGHDWESDRRIYNSHIIINDKGAVHSAISLYIPSLSYTHRNTQKRSKHINTHSHWHVVITPTGDVVSVYRKSHLFDVELPEKGVSLKESAFTIPGPSLVPPVQTPIGKVSFYEIIIITK